MIKKFNKSFHLWICLCALLLVLCFLVLCSFMLGSYRIPIEDTVRVVLGQSTSDTFNMIVWEFRMPRTIAAALAGMLFALSGATLQNLTRNPLADPSLIGVSQGASLAVVTAIVVMPGIGAEYRPVIALLGALIIAGIIHLIAFKKSEVSTMRFILTGIGIAAFLSAITSAMLTYGQINQAQAALSWLSGSVYNAGWKEVTVLGVVILIVLPVLLFYSQEVSIMKMGEDVSIGLGIRVSRIKSVLIIMSVVLAAAGVSTVGPLAFVGLIAPHLSKRLFCTDTGKHLLFSAVIGAIIVCLSDLLGRTVVAPFQISAGLVTMVIGAPFFLILMLKRYGG